MLRPVDLSSHTTEELKDIVKLFRLSRDPVKQAAFRVARTELRIRQRKDRDLASLAKGED